MLPRWECIKGSCEPSQIHLIGGYPPTGPMKLPGKLVWPMGPILPAPAQKGAMAVIWRHFRSHRGLEGEEGSYTVTCSREEYIAQYSMQPKWYVA